MFRAFMFVILFCASSASAAPIRFSSDVLPVLASKCFTCHGPDAEHRKAGLRLDQREGLFAPLKSGNIAVVPGDTSKSALFHRITTADPEEVMPPTDATKPLSDEEKQTLIRWIEEGAPWTGHWAFEPLRADAPPMIEGDSWSRNPIDQFIRAAQVERGLTPSPEADRRTLIRRLSFDLLGLPPTQEEVDRFIGDTRPDAWERLVDAMLASPRYGERWALHSGADRGRRAVSR